MNITPTTMVYDNVTIRNVYALTDNYANDDTNATNATANELLRIYG